MVTVFSALAEGAVLLRRNGIDTPRLDSEVLMAHVLGCTRLKLVVESSMPLDEERYIRFYELIDKRAHGAPAAYLVGFREFMGLDFTVGPGILIPRGDTEVLVESVIEECKRLKGTAMVADIGCGSGAIGISVCRYAPNARAVLVDISEEAVNTARRNAGINGVSERVKVIEGDLLSPVMGERFHIVASNPPYIESGIIPTLQREVRDYEPMLALDGGEDGLNYYRRLAAEAARVISPGGMIALEIGWDQADAVDALLRDRGFENIRVLKDLGGRDRCVTARCSLKQ